ncbi:MAG: hypothetical protein IPJ81_03765 [Chitinophagaceae bacterium]|nr:hypothetical protein [Chitinophagaceae bacterium]
MKNIILVSFFLGSTLFAFSQNTNRTVSKDSIAIWELRKIYHPLQLDSLQGAAFLAANKSHFSDLDEINKQSLNPGERKLALEGTKKVFNNKMKVIFSPDQYEKYKVIRENYRQQFLQRQKEKKVKVLEINDDL